MKSAALGQSTSPAEVTNVSPYGFWLFVGERELFVPFKDFPWFREASGSGNYECPASKSAPLVLAGPRRSGGGIHRTPGTIPVGEQGTA